MCFTIEQLVTQPEGQTFGRKNIRIASKEMEVNMFYGRIKMENLDKFAG